MDKKILIVGTVPYDPVTTARAFESYFNGCSKQNLAQIFSSPKTPIRGHCGTLFQITDQLMLRRWFCPRTETGRVFEYQHLEAARKNDEAEIENGVVRRLYFFGKRKNSLIYLLRGLIWRKSFWCTAKLNQWLDDFHPDCVFLSFSDDYFIPQIALYVAERYEVPIISSVGDDYYFNYRFSFSPLYHLYKLTYRKLIRKVFAHKGSAIYIGDKIRDKYNAEFGLYGKTIFLTSPIERRPYRPINIETPIISYFGNIRLGRNQSLAEIGSALCKINANYRLNIWSNEKDSKFYRLFKSSPNINFCGATSYEEVVKKTLESDIVIIVEGFKKKDVDITRYSLSTKVADSLASGAAVFAYGSKDCGAIEYAMSTGCIVTCCDKSKLEETLERLIYDSDLQRENYKKGEAAVEKNHQIKSSTGIFTEVVESVCKSKNVKR